MASNKRWNEAWKYLCLFTKLCYSLKTFARRILVSFSNFLQGADHNLHRQTICDLFTHPFPSYRIGVITTSGLHSSNQFFGWGSIQIWQKIVQFLTWIWVFDLGCIRIFSGRSSIQERSSNNVNRVYLAWILRAAVSK